MKNFSKILTLMFVFSFILGGFALRAENEGPDTNTLLKLTDRIYEQSQKNECEVGDFVKIRSEGPKPVKDPFTYAEYNRTIYHVKKVIRESRQRKLMEPAKEAVYQEARDAGLGDRIYTAVKEEDKEEKKTKKGGYFLVKQEEGPKSYYWRYRKKK